MSVIFTIFFEVFLIVSISILALNLYKLYGPSMIAERLISIYKLKKLTDLLKSKGESIQDLEEFYKTFKTMSKTNKSKIESIDEEYKIEKPSTKKAK